MNHTTWDTLKWLGQPNTYAFEAAAEGVICLSSPHRDGGTVNRHSWRKLKRQGWVDPAPEIQPPTDSFTSWRISEAGRERVKALLIPGRRPA